MDQQMSAGDVYEHGLTLKRVQMFDQAIDDFKQAAQDPQLAGKAQVQIALCLKGAGRHEEAVMAFRQVIVLPTLSSEERRHISYHMAQLLESLGRHDESLEIYGRIKKEDPGFRDVARRIKQIGSGAPGTGSSSQGMWDGLMDEVKSRGRHLKPLWEQTGQWLSTTLGIGKTEAKPSVGGSRRVQPSQLPVRVTPPAARPRAAEKRRALFVVDHPDAVERELHVGELRGGDRVVDRDVLAPHQSLDRHELKLVVHEDLAAPLDAEHVAVQRLDHAAGERAGHRAAALGGAVALERAALRRVDRVERRAGRGGEAVGAEAEQVEQPAGSILERVDEAEVALGVRRHRARFVERGVGRALRGEVLADHHRHQVAEAARTVELTHIWVMKPATTRGRLPMPSSTSERRRQSELVRSDLPAPGAPVTVSALRRVRPP